MKNTLWVKFPWNLFKVLIDHKSVWKGVDPNRFRAITRTYVDPGLKRHIIWSSGYVLYVKKQTELIIISPILTYMKHIYVYVCVYMLSIY